MKSDDKSPRVVLGASASHEWQLIAALRTLQVSGQVACDRWSLLLSGNREETDAMNGRLNVEFPGAQTISIDPREAEFQFLAPALERGLHALYFDYLRAWVWQRLSTPYLWIDSDVIVRGRLELEQIPWGVSHAMAADFPTSGISSSDFHQRMWSAYNEMLLAVGMKELTSRRDYSGHSRNLNCGVLYVGEDLSRDWRHTFERCLEILPRYRSLISPPEKYAAGAESTFGQGIWNVIFATREGRELDWRWNNLKMAYPDRQGMIDHYAVDKEAFHKDAKILGVL